MAIESIDSMLEQLVLTGGSKIDWKEEVFGSQFEISNPNSSSSCGCGESFGV